MELGSDSTAHFYLTLLKDIAVEEMHSRLVKHQLRLSEVCPLALDLASQDSCHNQEVDHSIELYIWEQMLTVAVYKSSARILAYLLFIEESGIDLQRNSEAIPPSSLPL